MISKIRLRMKAARLLTAFVALAAGYSGAQAQDNQQSQYDRGTPPQHAAGVSSIGSYISADIGTINLANGSLNFRLPLGNVGGRGFWLPLTLNYTSKNWSGSRGTIFETDPTPHTRPVVWGAYSDGTENVYNSVAPGWTVGAAPYLKARGVGINSINNPGTGCTDFSWVVVKLTLVLPDKGEIELRDDQLDGAPVAAQPFGTQGCRIQDGYRGKRWHATDGSGIVFINDTDNGVVIGDLRGVVITGDGTRYHFRMTPSSFGSAYINLIAQCDWIRDRNGNKVLISYPNSFTIQYSDQLGRITTVRWDDPFNPLFDPENAGVRLALLVTLPGYNGAVRYYKVKTAAMNLNYRQSPNPINPALPVYNGYDSFVAPPTILFAGGIDAGTERIDDKTVLTQLILPDGRALTFKYNEFGEVAEVQMPTGGKVQYDYQSVLLDTVAGTGLPAGNTLNVEAIAPGGGNVRAVDRAVVAQRTYPDGSTQEGSWSYSYEIDKTEVKCTSAGVPLLDEWHYFLPAQRFLTGSTTSGADGTGYSLWSTGVERRSEMRDSNGTTVLSAAEQDWAQRASLSWSTGFAPTQQIANDNRITQTRKYLDDGSFSKIDTFYDATLGSQNHINNPIQVDEYDFDQTLKRRSTTSYFTGGNYTGTGVNTLNILSLPLVQAVYEPADVVNPKSTTTYEYDNYTPDGSNNHAALQSYSPDAINHDPGFDFNYATRGNPTQITRMVNSSTSVISYPRYDTLGNVVSTKDPRGYVTTISFTDDFGNGAAPGFGVSGTFGPTYSLPTLITSPPPNLGEPAQTARSQYDFSTGLLTGFKDRNGIITQTIYNDQFDRPTQVKSALGTSAENHAVMYYAPAVVFGVNLANNDVLTAKDQVGIDDSTLRSWTKTDGFGRTIEGWMSDPQGNVKVATSYDGLGRVSKTSNPFRTGETQYDTTTGYDLAGRVRTVTTADNAVVTTAYNGARVLVIDQAGKQRISKTDGLGRLTDVWEIRSADAVTGTEPVTFPNHPEVTAGYRTKYSYDALDELAQVTQQIGTTGTTQHRYFMYDSLKRLIRARNPEQSTNPNIALSDPLTGNNQWSVKYAYDANSNLSTKTDARDITTTYTYDALNRVASRTYGNDPQSTPAVSYKYDGQPLVAGFPAAFARGSSIGRLVAVTYGGGSAGNYTGYDQMGRANVSYQQTDSQNYGFTNYSYNLASEMTSQTYPSGKVVQTEYDSAGRVSGVKKQGTQMYYAGGFQYTAHGAVSAMLMGNGRWERTSFNSRLQPTQIALDSNTSGSNILKLDYVYGTATTNNGNVTSQTITVPNPGGGNLVLTQNYSYDALNRLASASENSGSSWTQTYDYDRFGNRAVRSGSYLPTPRQTPVSNSPADLATLFDQGKNRITATSEYVYDTGGNLTSMPNKVQGFPADTMTYDAENRQKTFNGTVGQYSYDGDGRRVKKVDSSGTTVFVYNVAGQLIAEYTTGTPAPGDISYLTTDHLGSTRLVTDAGGNVKARYDYVPFGEEIGANIGARTVAMGYVGSGTTRQKFTQKERDNESGLDYFLARYYSSAQGRFTSPDEFTGGPDELYEFAVAASENPTFYAVLTNPQSLNKYQYAYNNPLRFVDLDGHQGPVQLADRLLNNPQAQQAAQRAGVWAARAGAAAGAYLSGALTKLGKAAKNFLAQDVSDDPTGLVKLRANEIGGKIDQQTQDRGGEAGDPGKGDKKPVFGEKGTQTTSTTVYRGAGKERIDVENPNPGQRSGQVHYQDNKGNKYLYDPAKKEFIGASKSLNKRLLSDRGIQKGVEKALKVLGESQ